MPDQPHPQHTHEHFGHDHGIGDAPEKALWWALIVTGSLMLTEFIGGWLTNSLALISDAAHMLTDTAALAIAITAITLGRRPADARRTFGYARFEILAAVFNATALLFAAIYIFYQGIQRINHPPEIQTTTMMIIGIAGLIANLISMRLLHAGSKTSLNIKGAYLEVWSDMLGSLGVIAAGIIIRATGWTIVDPILAIGLALWVLPRSWILLKESFNILLEGVPAGMNTDEIKAAIQSIPGVTSVHDLHVWAVSNGKLLMTAHVQRTPETLQHENQLLDTIHHTLKEDFGIRHSTIQLETDSTPPHDCEF